MEHEEFLYKLRQLATIKPNGVPKSGNVRQAKEPCEIDRHGKIINITLDNNPTITWVVDKIKQTQTECEDCGKCLTKPRRVTKQIYQVPELHWRHHCQNCNCTRDPETKEYKLTGVNIHNRHLQYFKNKSISKAKK